MTAPVFTTLDSTGPAPRDDYDKAQVLVNMLATLSAYATSFASQAAIVSLQHALEYVAARMAGDEAPVEEGDHA